MKKRAISILGSTGSIGTSALDVVRHLHPFIEVKALAVGSNIALLEAQVREFSPELIAVFDEKQAEIIQKRLPGKKVLSGAAGVEAVARFEKSDLVLSAIVGTRGIAPTMAALEEGKDIALANKEVLVSAGAQMMALARKKGAKILPVDSEHSALFQCLENRDISSVRRLILTASGGPFFRLDHLELASIKVEDALRHPTWRMGKKITIDSSTLMNKGLEVIEASWLFGLPLEKIEVVIHPQSVIHSMVEFIDGSILAQMSQPDMRLPIQYAFTYPERCNGLLPPFDFNVFSKLDFLPVDRMKFRCLELAYEALKIGQSLPCYMNAANEVLVERFSNGSIGWLEIAEKLGQLMRMHDAQAITHVSELLAIDAHARHQATTI